MPVFDDPFTYFSYNQEQRRQPQQVKADITQRFQSPEEEEGTLQKFLGAGMSGLGYVGGVLDKTFGGRAIRGALGGNARELLSVVPGSDTLGITDESQRVSGEDLAKQWGLIEGNKPKGEFDLTDLVGPAIEMGLDPGTYLTFGGSALTKGGQAAKKLGVLPKTLAGRIKGFQTIDDAANAMRAVNPKLASTADAAAHAAQFGHSLADTVGAPLGGWAGVGLPFSHPSTVLGTGPAGLKAAEFAGSMLDKAKYSWLGQRASRLFDPTVLGLSGEQAQRSARSLAPDAQAAETAMRGAYHDMLQPLRNVDFLDQNVGPALRRSIETPGAYVGPYSNDVLDALQESAGRYRKIKDAELAAETAAGIPKSPYKSVFGIKYATSFPTPLPNAESLKKGARSGEALSTRLGTSIRREEMFDMSPRGREFIEQLVADPRIAGRERVPTDVLGNPLARITADTPRKQQAVQHIVNLFLSGQPNANRRILRLIREELLGAGPNALAAGRPFARSELRQLEALAAAGTLPAGQVQRLEQLRELQDQAKYLTRRLYQTRNEASLWKNPAEEVIPALNRAMQDRAAERILTREYLAKEGFDPQRLEQLRQMQLSGAPMTPDDLTALTRMAHQERQAPRLARWLGDVSQQRVGPDGVGLFRNDPLMEGMLASEQSARALGRADIAQDVLGKNAVVTRTPEPGMVPARDVLKGIGLTGKYDVSAGTKTVKARYAEQNLLDTLNASGAFPGGKVRDIRNVWLTPDVAEQVLQMRKADGLPDAAGDILGKLGGLTSLTKTMMTAPRPGFHARNLLSSAWQNLAMGATGGNTTGAAWMNELRQGAMPRGIGQAIPDFAARGLTDAEAAAELGREMFTQRAAGRGMAPTREAERLGGGVQQLAESIPGAVPEPKLADILSGYIPRSRAEANPLNVEGFGGRNVTQFAPVKAGRQMGDLIDDLTRGGGYLDLRRQGYVPEAAAEMARQAHFDYGRNLTDFERNWVRPLVPFYNFQKAVIPQTARMLAETPGGLTGQGVRLSNAMRQQEGFMPSYLGGGLAVPVGGEDETGNRRYITQLGLPYEDVLNQLQTGPGGLSKTAMKLLGNLNPLLKGPLEVATNRQFYSGRELNDLYSRTGMPMLDQALMNSPAQPLAYAAGTLADPRKDWLATLLNLGTGIKVSDVDMKKQRNAAIQDLRDMLTADPSKIGKYESVSPRADQLQNLTGDEVQQLRLLRAMEKKAQEQAKKDKATRQAVPQ